MRAYLLNTDCPNCGAPRRILAAFTGIQEHEGICAILRMLCIACRKQSDVIYRLEDLMRIILKGQEDDGNGQDKLVPFPGTIFDD